MKQERIIKLPDIKTLPAKTVNAHKSHPRYSSYLHGLRIWKKQSVPKRRHIKFRSKDITQRKYTIFRTRRKFEKQEHLLNSIT